MRVNKFSYNLGIVSTKFMEESNKKNQFYEIVPAYNLLTILT